MCGALEGRKLGRQTTPILGEAVENMALGACTVEKEKDVRKRNAKFAQAIFNLH
jgi:hypothetical protein